MNLVCRAFLYTVCYSFFSVKRLIVEKNIKLSGEVGKNLKAYLIC